MRHNLTWAQEFLLLLGVGVGCGLSMWVVLRWNDPAPEAIRYGLVSFVRENREEGSVEVQRALERARELPVVHAEGGRETVTVTADGRVVVAVSRATPTFVRVVEEGGE